VKVLCSIILLILLMIYPSTVAKSSLWDVGGCLVLACVPSIVKSSIDETGDHLSGDAQQLYMNVMNDFVSNKLPEMLSQLDTLATKHEVAVKQMLDEVKDISDSLIATINSGIKDINVLVQKTFQQADSFVDKIACVAEGTTANAMSDAQAGLQNIIDKYVPRWFVPCLSG
jgi:hypothetical protein